jgi:hypothetical protein
MKSWLPALYFVIGQAGWFACVLGAAHGAPAIGAAVVVVMLIAHLWRIPRPREELKFLASAVLIGTLWETAVVRLQLLSYPSGNVLEGFPPYWIVALWALFAAQFNTTYNWLKGRPMVAAALGAVAGPLSFRAGAALGAVQFERPLAAYSTLAAGWAVILPLLIVVSRRWDGVRPAPPS